MSFFDYCWKWIDPKIYSIQEDDSNRTIQENERFKKEERENKNTEKYIRFISDGNELSNEMINDILSFQICNISRILNAYNVQCVYLHKHILMYYT